MDEVRPVVWEHDCLFLLDQRKLPEVETYLQITSVAQCTDAIKSMVVRGAPAIGCAAAYGFYLGVKHHNFEDLRRLEKARPTAVNLGWAIARMRKLEGCTKEQLLNEAHAILKEDIQNCKIMGRLGASLIDPESQVLTHCNAGALATGGYGTALGVIRTAYADGNIRAVFANETRPLLQGSRLTAWELAHDDIPVTVMTESSAATLMSGGKIKWLIVGADRIALNGDVANKMGTYTMAILAKHFRIPVMVVAPTSTVDVSHLSGATIPIEERSGTEVWKGEKNDLITFRNRAFDITPHELIEVIVTEQGMCKPHQLKELMSEQANS